MFLKCKEFGCALFHSEECLFLHSYCCTSLSCFGLCTAVNWSSF